MKLTGVSFIFHLIGIVFWIGSSFLLPLVVIPAVRALDTAAQIIYIQVFKKKFLPLLIGSALIVGLTGWYQTVVMEKDLNIPAIYTKHIVILVLIIVTSYIWFFLTNRLIKSLADNKGIWGRYTLFAWLQAVIGIAVLICTGWLTQ